MSTPWVSPIGAPVGQSPHMHQSVTHPVRRAAAVAAFLFACALFTALSLKPADASVHARDGRIYFEYGQRGKAAFIGSVKPDGTGFKKLVRGGSPSASLVDGRTAFTGTFGGKHTLLEGCMTVDARGRNKKLIVGSERLRCFDPTFSPNGKFIAFNKLSFVKNPDHPGQPDLVYGVAIKNLKTGERHVLANDVIPTGAPAFTPNSKNVIFPLGNEMKIAKVNGLAHDLGELQLDKGRLGDPTVSPSGKSIIFPVFGGRPTNPGLYKAKRDGSGAHLVNDDPLDDDSGPSFAPSGRRIALAFRELFTLKPDGSGQGPDLSPRPFRVARVSWDSAR
jgi:hypothetical protein